MGSFFWGINMKLEYFYFDGCPFCSMVEREIKSLNIKVDYCDIYGDSAHLDRLVKDTGRRTVPCLYIDDEPMFESRDIIQWLKQNQDKLPKV